jgi:hypothetical protein
MAMSQDTGGGGHMSSGARVHVPFTGWRGECHGVESTCSSVLVHGPKGPGATCCWVGEAC